MDLTTTNAYPAFRSVLLDTPSRELAARLYGPDWESSLVRTERGWRTRRLPKAAYLLPVLAPLLAGRVAFDGRSHRETRTGGWWASITGGAWHPVSLSTVGLALLQVTDPLVEAAI